MRRCRSMLAGLGLALVVAPVGAETPTEDEGAEVESGAAPHSPEDLVATAQRALEELRYEDAIALAEEVPPDAPGVVRMDSLAIRAKVHLIRGDTALAVPLLQELYTHAPAFVLNDPSLPPRVTRMFLEEAGRTHARAVSLELHDDGDDRVSFAISAAGDTRAVELHCRSGAGPFLEVKTGYARGRAKFRLPTRGRFRCYATAVDDEGLPLGRLGTVAAPIAIVARSPPVPTPDAPVTTTWWFWTSIGGGAAVVAGVIAVAVVLSQPTDRPSAELEVPLGATDGLAVGYTLWAW